jgi:Cu/Zn superoxide dismutase
MFDDIPFDPGFGNDFMLTAELSGANEVPEVTSDGVGLATFYFDQDRTTVHVNVTVTGLSSAITGAHIHEAATGANGPVVFPLAVVGNRIQMEIPNVTPAQLANFISGNYYINVHTTEHPGGEIRGQISIDQDATFIATMNGTQEVPPVTTDARGLGVFHYTWGDTTLDVNIQVTELSSDITGAHLHLAPAGENGPVIFDLGNFREGNTFRGRISGLTIFDILNLLAGNVYVNVHTANNTGGEIRGQLIYQNGLSFDGWMSGSQEVPFALTAASALGAATVSPDLGTVQFWMVSDQVTGNVTAAHFHNAPIGTNGGVVLDLSSGLDDNDINFSGPISADAVSALLTGSIYANAHTAAYPGGEFRGQMFRLARDGYGFDLCTQQETGNINAPNATGNGYASIDRLHTNLNLGIAVDGLTGPITGAHIHKAPIGVNGGVILPFPAFEDMITGYGIPADSTVIAAILTDSAYINVHTAMHPGGEVRGQIVKEFLCTLETGVNELEDIVSEVSLSPVPVIDRLNVTIESNSNTDLTMSVFDLSGKLLSVDKFELTQGQNVLQIPTHTLSPGFYTLMISDGHAAQAYKFVK